MSTLLSYANNRKSWTMDELGISGLEVKRSVRGTFPRYMVFVDGETFYPKTPKTLGNLLSDIIGNKKPRVFRNAGKGITINFDN